MSFGMMEWAKKLGMMYSVSLLKQELRAPEPLLITGCIIMLYNMYPKHSMYGLLAYIYHKNQQHVGK